MISAAALAVIVLAVVFKLAGGGERPVAEPPSNHHQPNRNPQPLNRVAAPAPGREPRLVIEPEPEPTPVLASRDRVSALRDALVRTVERLDQTRPERFISPDGSQPEATAPTSDD